MRPLLAAVLCALFLAPAAALGQGGDGIFPFDYRRVDLENGLRAYLIPAGSPGQIAYVSIVRTGSRDEVEQGKSGFAHFFEHMMFRGTEKYPNYDAVTSSMGAARNAFTSFDQTVYYMVASSDYLEQIVDLESDRFMNLDYSEEGFRIEAGAILGEYGNNAGSPGFALYQATQMEAFDVHTYRHTVIGFEEDIRAMPEGFDYSVSFYDRFYRPENVVLVVAGDFDLDEAESLIREYYVSWEPGYQPAAVPVEPPQGGERRRIVEYDGQTLPILTLNYKGPAWSPDDRIAVATEVLGRLAFGPNSDIYRKLVLDERSVQYLQAGFGLQRDPGLLSIGTMVMDAGDLQRIEEEIEATVVQFQDELVDPESLERTKSNMKYGFLMGLETAQNVAFSTIEPVVNTGGIEAIDQYYATLDAVTPEDVREAARRYLVEDSRTVITLIQRGGGR